MMINHKMNHIQQVPHDKGVITLVGMMGTGKSKFGHIVAKRLAFNFYDTDNLIERKFNTSIKQIFEMHGEAFFRKVEKETIKKIVVNACKSNEQAVISIGGGAFDNEDTRTLLLKDTRVIWLNTPVETLVKRIGDGSKRPMIIGDVKRSINKTLNSRIKYYSLSHYQLDTNSLTQDEITNKIINMISK